MKKGSQMLPSLIALSHQVTRPIPPAIPAAPPNLTNSGPPHTSPSLVMQGTKTGCCDETGLVFAVANMGIKAYKGWIKAKKALNQAKAKLDQAREAVDDWAKATEEQRAKIAEIAEEVARLVNVEKAARRTAS